MAVGQTVIEHLPLAAHGDQPRLLERLELIGDGAGGHVKRQCKVARAALVRVERKEDLEPRVRAHRAEKLRQRGDLFPAGRRVCGRGILIVHVLLRVSGAAPEIYAHANASRAVCQARGACFMKDGKKERRIV